MIFENCFLQDEHKERLCRICGEVRADFVKTSTGYGSSGATDEDLADLAAVPRLTFRSKPPAACAPWSGCWQCGPGVTRVGATATKAILDDCKMGLADGPQCAR